MARLRVLPVALVAGGAVVAAVVLASSSASVESTTRAAARLPHAGLYGLGLSRLPSSGDYRQMLRGGVGTVRFVLDWRRAQPTADGDFRWGQSDRYIHRAAESRITVLPVLFGTPGWLAPTFIK